MPTLLASVSRTNFPVRIGKPRTVAVVKTFFNLSKASGRLLFDLNSYWTICHSERLKVKKLILQYRDVSATSDRPEGQTKLVQHKFNTGESTPIRQTHRRLLLAKRKKAKKIFDEMKKQNVIEGSNSPWVLPMGKKYGSTRFCVDYCQLNNVTKKDSYPLPRIDDSLDTLAKSSIISTLVFD